MNNSSPWFSIIVAVIVVVVLSAFSATKRFAYWIGGLVLVALLLAAWKGKTL